MILGLARIGRGLTQNGLRGRVERISGVRFYHPEVEVVGKTSIFVLFC